MPSFRDADISIGTWVEMTHDVPMRYEVSDLDDNAALYFGQHDDYVLVICRENLARLLTLAGNAILELNKHHPRRTIRP
jgi:hypothetical protein